MKRIAVIVGIVLSITVAVGAFVIAGDDQSSEAKSSETTQKAQGSSSKKESGDTKNFALVVAGATKVASGAPVPKSDDKKSDDGKNENESDDDKNDGDDDGDKYEARKAFVGVSPRKVQEGKTVEVQVRGFAPNSTVTVNVTKGGITTKLADVPTNSKGRGKIKAAAPAVGEYKVTAVGSSATSKLTVEPKKKK